MSPQADTICALTTPNGIGAIGVIRVSGRDALKCISPFFSRSLNEKTSHTVHFGTFSSAEGVLIDEVLVTLFLGNKSFTGEESVEIAAHGSPYILQAILKTLTSAGCRMAEPGEFTMRAFMNGKMDLSQAEAVADLIASQSRNAHEIALKQLRGKFSTELKDLREKLIHFASLVELELDFAEEDVEFADRNELKLLLEEVLLYLKRLIQSFELGNAIKNGVPVAIVGEPNTGKSTLLNQLLGEERAIVSNIAGTTRDVIEETLNIDGILFRLIDTAGIREGAEEIEAMGIERSFAKIELATIVLCMADLSRANHFEQVISWAKQLLQKHPNKKVLIVANKSDIAQKEIEKCEINTVQLSAKSGHNIEELKSVLVQQVLGNFDLNQDTIVSNARHVEALEKTVLSLEQARSGLEANVTADFVAMDIRQAMYWLGTITGQISEDDLLANIFSKFCIGK
jgi:tRNA modification GTPase